MSADRSAHSRSGFVAALELLAFAVAAYLAVAAALATAPPVMADLPRTLVGSPPGRGELDAGLSGPADQQRFEAWGLSRAAAQALVGAGSTGYGRVWQEARGGRKVVAFVLQESDLAAAASVWSDITFALESLDNNPFSDRSVSGVNGALEFIIHLAGARRVVSTVGFRRGRLVFVVEVASENPESGLARAVAVELDHRAPAGDSSFPPAAIDSLARLLGVTIFLGGGYLFIIDGGPGFWRRRRQAHRFRSARGESSAGVALVDVSREVDIRRGVSRAAFVTKLVGAVLVLPLFDRPLFPYSLLGAALGVAAIAWGAGIERYSRRAAAGWVIFTQVLALSFVAFPLLVLTGHQSWRPVAALVSIVGISLNVIARLALTPIVGGDAVRDPGPPRASRYRRLFTGRRRIRVVGLLVLAALLSAVGIVGLEAGSATLVVLGETPTRHLLGALACIGLSAVPYRRARRHAAQEAAFVADRDSRAPILYLRSFGDDRLKIRTHGGPARYSSLERLGYHRRGRFEEVIAGCLWAHGPVIAVGQPGERLVPIGAARMSFDEESWQAGVELWMARARLIVITVGRTTGLSWEIARVAELGLMDRTILLFPPVPTPELERRWQLFTATSAAAGIELAGDLGLAWVLAATATDTGLMAFEGPQRDEWNYASALHTAARGLLSRRTDLVLPA